MELKWMFGTRCNHRCPYCVNFDEPNARMRPDGSGECVSAELLDATVRLINGWPERFTCVNVIGGEPSIAPNVLACVARLRNVDEVELATNGSNVIGLRRLVDQLSARIDVELLATIHMWPFVHHGAVNRRLLTERVDALRALRSPRTEVTLKILIGDQGFADHLVEEFLETIRTLVDGDPRRLLVTPIRRLTKGGSPRSNTEAYVEAHAALRRLPSSPAVEFARAGLAASLASWVGGGGCVDGVTGACTAVGQTLRVHVDGHVDGCPLIGGRADVHDPEGVWRMIAHERMHIPGQCPMRDGCELYNCVFSPAQGGLELRNG